MPPAKLSVSPSNSPHPHASASEGWVTLDGQQMYRIPDFDRMPPFLMSIVSDSDLWMYLSSNGGLTCGRVNAEGSLFPYVTDDKLHQAHAHTGPVTVFQVQQPGGKHIIWEPFRTIADGHIIQRNLYKNAIGNSVLFEEINHTLGLSFRYRWSNSDAYGFIRTATLANLGPSPVDITLLDGLINLIPACVALGLQQTLSCLMNSYTRCEVDAQTGMGMFSLAAVIVDQAKPAEALRATVVWSRGLPNAAVLLSPERVAAFRQGQSVAAESLRTGRSGGYLVTTTLQLKPTETITWQLIADVERSQLQVESLLAAIINEPYLDDLITDSIAAGDASLRRNVASSDGLQTTADPIAGVHHFANVLFNNMRGGVFARNYTLPATDFVSFIHTRNQEVAANHQDFLSSLTGQLDYHPLLKAAEERADKDLLRLTQEYLPLTFGRRHGDPSRPWNRFTIHIKNPDGSRALNYQGNWRDIFQNWESMSQSFPDFLESIIAKFVNASTIDGFNPYRITRDGIDWEAPNPEDPWATIGYWGDHQIIYLLKLLESSHRFHPGALDAMLGQAVYSYANVPYRIKPYDAILHDPRSTIDFDRTLEKQIEQRVAQIGTDGKLLPDSTGNIYHVTLAEKLLVPALSKLSNLVVDGGIWMNTQRPEWNDANNALVGFGVSMVTLCYLHRYLTFCADVFDRVPGDVPISSEVAAWFAQIADILRRNQHLLNSPEISDADRKCMLDSLGTAFSNYRAHVYAHGFSAAAPLPLHQIASFFKLANEYLRHAIRANRRPDGLYHAYNLLHVSQDAAAIGRLYEMLEGQVAGLSSGLLSADEAAALLDALFASRMYRPDQQSFMLYPNRDLPGFLQKNLIPEPDIKANPLLSQLIAAGDASIVARDAFGHYRFNSSFRAADDLDNALAALAANPQWQPLVNPHRPAVLETYERVFHHREFTGRSGSMYGYEGLGCIYWHMVAKLLLATQECCLAALQSDPASAASRNLIEHYFRIRAGLGFNKTAKAYGAFPTDPYSHTPAHAGAQQPGMTGQVKEEILTRMGELGVRIEAGEITFRPQLLRRREFAPARTTFDYFDVHSHSCTLTLPPNSLAFTLCQIPIIYELTDSAPTLTIHHADGHPTTLPAHRLAARTSRSIFARTGHITRIHVQIPRSALPPEPQA